MRFSILAKLFFSFMITIILLFGMMIGLIQFFAFRNFSEYVHQRQIENVGMLTTSLERIYKKNNNWDLITKKPVVWQRLLANGGIYDDRQNTQAENQNNQPPEQQPPPFVPGQTDNFRPGPPPRGDRPDFPPPRPQYPPEASQFDIRPRLSLFDKDYLSLAGPARSTQNHILRPIVVNNKTVGYLGLRKLEQLKHPLEIDFLKKQKQAFYLTGAIALFVAILVAFFISRYFIKPIRKLSMGTQALSSRKFETRIEVKTSDEFGQLASDFNLMAQTLADYELRQQQWLSDISHELRTPLSILRGEIEAVFDGIRNLNEEMLQSVYDEVMRLNRLVNDIHCLSLAEAKMLQIRKDPVNVLSILSQTISRFSKRFETQNIVVELKLNQEEHAIVIGDHDRLTQLFVNLLENTLKYTDPPGKLLIANTYASGQLIINYEDSLPGVPPLSLSRLFDRLFRIDYSRSRTSGGSGLGLAICKHIVEIHRGSITARNSSLGGLKFEIRFPVTPAAKGLS